MYIRPNFLSFVRTRKFLVTILVVGMGSGCLPTLDRTFLDFAALQVLLSVLPQNPATTPPGILDPPVFTPPPGTFSVSVGVTLSSSTPGSQIYWTQDGTNPSCDGSGSSTVGVYTDLRGKTRKNL